VGQGDDVALVVDDGPQETVVERAGRSSGEGGGRRRDGGVRRGSRRGRPRARGARAARRALGLSGARSRGDRLTPPGTVAGRCETAGHGPLPCRATSVLDEEIDSTSRERSEPLLE